MTLPLMLARAGCRGGWRSAGAALLILAGIHAAGMPVRAQDADQFTATVKVDATADSTAKARETARIEGQRRAFAAMVERFSGGNPPAKLPKLDDNAIAALVDSFEVANERMSAVRYVADYTFHFRPAELRRVLGNAGIAAAAAADRPVPAADLSAKPVVLVPVYQSGGQLLLWEDPNPWRDSWERQPASGGPAKIVVPLGDAGDIAAIDAAKARAGDAAALAAVARNNGADDAVVALAAIRGAADKPTGLDVTLQRYRAGRLVETRSDALAARASDSAGDLLGRAVAAITGDFGTGWKKETAAVPDQAGSLTAVLPISSLEDWLRARERLGAVQAIRQVALVSLSRQEATIEIGYAGSIDQLKEGLAQISLDLVRGDPAWRLARTGAVRTP
jgi:hypothetical protein